jgi:hypothetical protein
MLRQCGAAVAVLALLYGVSAAPYAHAHHAIDSASDEHHPMGATLVHMHASPHAHHDADRHDPEPAGDDDRGDRIWSIDSFAFQPPAPNRAPSPVLLVFGEPHVQLTCSGSRADRLQPKAHGPPVGSSSGLRAPPAFPPTFV